MKANTVLLGDSAEVLAGIPTGSVDLIYADPPFGTQQDQEMKERRSRKTLVYADRWESPEAYLNWLKPILVDSRRVLKDTGALFLHCDWRMNHRIRLLLDEVFGETNFQNEIIWSYKRWTNNTSQLQRLHQNIYYYSASPHHQMNVLMTEYSPTTNLDQIWQARTRDENGKSIYATDENGEHLAFGKAKKGVPLGDVWEIPYLNPKARERVGYPTQKPVELLIRIITLGSQPGDLVLDPFCGSGTTLVAAQQTQRNYLGIDTSEDAIRISAQRLERPHISHSVVARHGRQSFLTKVDNPVVKSIIEALWAHPVYRNSSLDGFLTKTKGDLPVGLRIVPEGYPVEQCAFEFGGVLKKKRCAAGILVCSESALTQGVLPFSIPSMDNRVPILFTTTAKVLSSPQAVLKELEELLS